MSPELASWLEGFRRALERIDTLVEDLSNDQANWSPGPGQWSINECLGHLNSTTSTYFRNLGPALEQAQAQGLGGDPPYHKGPLLGRWLASFLAKGPSTKVKSPKVFLPKKTALELNPVSEEYRALLGRWIEICGQAKGLALGRIRFRTPVSPLVRVSLNQAFRIHTLHYHRHLDQADRVKAQLA